MTSSRGQGSGRGKDPHGWNALDNYLSAHFGCLDGFRDHFVLEDDLECYFEPPDAYRIRGRLRCHPNLFLYIDKTLEVNDRRQVRTVRYNYHAGMEGTENRPIFRYDNAHRYAHEGHADEHHKHRFNHTTWQEINPPEWVGRERWPHLDAVIQELSDWWRETGDARARHS